MQVVGLLHDRRELGGWLADHVHMPQAYAEMQQVPKCEPMEAQRKGVRGTTRPKKGTLFSNPEIHVTQQGSTSGFPELPGSR